MQNSLLERANQAQTRGLAQQPVPIRPAFHVTGGAGWINDPNGFSCYRGEYHLFYQYYPHSVLAGLKYWGHAKTRDFIHWEALPVALAPDSTSDARGCFSGSAIELPDGRHLLMYTGVCEETAPDGTRNSLQAQCLAIGDGLLYEKWAHNPVISAADLPPGTDPANFRDPKIFRAEDGSYRAVIATRYLNDRTGVVLLYESPDGFRWQLRATLDASRGELGNMWECPDFFSLDGTDVLLVNPQQMTAKGLEFHPGCGSICLLGRLNPQTGAFERETVHSLDYGIDFYAPQTLETPDGRRILIAWMQNWDSAAFMPSGATWFGQMTLPRELRVCNGRLLQQPVRELSACRARGFSIRNSRETRLEIPGGRMVDLTLTVRPETPEKPMSGFRLALARGNAFETTIRFEPEAGRLVVDRTGSGFPYDIVNTRAIPVFHAGRGLPLRVILDRWSLELFVNGGEQCASFTLYTPQSADGILLECAAPLLLDIEKYDLEV